MADNDENSDSDSGDELVKHHGMIQPSLVELLKKILQEYRDDGQILKELIQNAEDAEASEMKILYDGRPFNMEEDGGADPFRSYFKGPALVIYNNAEFSRDDWRGIGMMYSSIKELDRTKVGRFGLGFKSVFHVTDTPVVISGRKLVIIDPHREREKECPPIRLKNLQEVDKMSDCMNCLSGLFGFSQQTLDSGKFKGTLFRFPLRRAKTELSHNIYEQSKVSDLFRSFQTEASESLLFLKSLERIELCLKDSENQNIETIFSVSVAGENISQVRDARQNLLRQLNVLQGEIPEESVNSYYKVTMETFKENEKMSKPKKWLIYNMLKGKENMSEQFLNLALNKEWGYHPYAGIAVPFDQDEDFRGHIFCFLPLPLDSENHTELPVHINGFFSLEQNRRHVKWATEDQMMNISDRDENFIWNECILAEVLSEVYLLVIEYLIDMSKGSGNPKNQVAMVSKCMPDKTDTSDRMNIMVDQFYKGLIGSRFLFTSSNGGQWIECTEAVFGIFSNVANQEVGSDVEETVLMLMKQYNQNLVEVPPHLWNMIQTYGPSSVQCITPSYIRSLLKLSPVYRNFTAEEKIHILQFVLEDGSYCDLNGLKLLPLHNGEFECFKKQSKKIYSCDVTEIEMFPGVEDRFLKTNLPETVQTHLQCVVSKGWFQIEKLQKADFIDLLQQSISINLGNSPPLCLRWKSQSTISEIWLSRVWNYIKASWPKSLLELQQIPVLPIETDNGYDLYDLTGYFILKTCRGFTDLPDAVCTCLKHLSVIIIPSLPSYVLDHLALMDEYVFYPSVEGVLSVLGKMSNNEKLIKLINNFNENIDPSEREGLIQYLGNAQNIPEAAKHVLCQLNVFHSTSGKEMVSVNKLQSIAPADSFPVAFPEPMIHCRNKNERHVALLLGAEEISKTTVMQKIIEHLSCGVIYSDEDKHKFMKFLGQNIESVKSHRTTMEYAREIRFIPTCSGTIKKAIDLFSPKEQLLLDLFPDGQVFPKEMFWSDFNLFNLLCHLGLKSINDITASDVLDSVKCLDEKCRRFVMQDKDFKQSEAILKMLEEHPHLLNQHVHKDGTLKSALNDLLFIKPKQQPTTYPKILKWYRSPYALCSSSEVIVSNHCQLVGSVRPLLPDGFPCHIVDELGCNKAPSTEEVVQQLMHIIAKYQDQYKPELLPLLKSVYLFLSERIDNCDCLRDIACVWTGDGFKKPEEVYLNSGENDVDLRPYMYQLPNEFQTSPQIKSLFRKMGSPDCQQTQKLLDVQEVIRQTVCGKRAKKDDVRRNLDIIVNILQRFHDEEVKNDKILFPVQTNYDDVLELRPAEECHYCNSNWLEDLTEEEGEEIYYVHERVSAEIARNLGVPSLTDTLLSGTEAFGPSEVLTSRIRSLLQNYTDGFSVPKELVQNADDAGASRVCFLYDERENEGAREKLIHPNMSECQGPALWAYNDALFTDEDLHNIRRINDSKKKEDSSTVGKFGLGFCSVYNLTDVPSFVSGDHIVIFDPIGKYLGDSHGRKISLGSGKNLRLVRKMKDQFIPFNGVFGCNLNVLDKEVNYKGTLFRLPLRTASQAKKNELVGDEKPYTKSEMQCLLKMFMEAAGNMLLFTQSVAEIELYHLPSDAKDPSMSNLIYRVGRTIEYTEDIKLSRFNTAYEFMTGHRIQVLKYMSSQLEKLEISSKDSVKESLHLSAKMDIEVEVKKGAVSLCQIENVLKENTSWIIAWASGVNEGLTKTSRQKKFSGLLPLAGTAVMIGLEEDLTKPRFLEDAPFGFYKTAHYFCCLPLPVESGLPIHVNASFAVTSDRRNLCVKTTDDKELSDGDWNVMLMSGGVCNAYILILETLKQFGIKPEENLYDLWPVCTLENSIQNVLQNSFYNRIILEDHALFPCKQIYASYENCCFLDVSFQNSNIFQIAFDTAIRFYENENRIIINLPERIMSVIRQVGGEEKLNEKMITPHVFYQQILFPNIQSDYWEDKTESRDALVLFALDMNDGGVNDLIKSHPCIPTEPAGKLKMPKELVLPWGNLYSLFSIEDERFIKVDEVTFLENSRLNALEGLGAMVNTMPEELLCECADSIQKLSSDCQQCAYERSINFMKYLQTFDQNQQISSDEIWSQLREITFLPALEKPEIWTLPWKCSEIDSEEESIPCVISCEKTEHLHNATTIEHNKIKHLFKKPTELFSSKHINLVGCTKYILGESKFCTQQSVLSKLGVQGSMDSSIPLQAVVDQLILLSKTDIGDTEVSSLELLARVCSDIYRWFDQWIMETQDKNDGLFLKSQLENMPVILTGNVFVKPEQVAVSLDADYSPYLYGISSFGLKNCKRFLELMDIKEHFSVENILRVLLKIQKPLIYSVLESDELNINLKLIKYLAARLEEESLDSNMVLTVGGHKLLVPDENCCLKDIKDVCMNDSTCKKSGRVSYVHEQISLAEATVLSIETKRVKKLQEHSRAIPFGPKEEITTRIRKLLRSYPCDEGIMKELLQNADDSEAKELHIIKDFRCHGLEENDEKWKTKIFDKKWKLLQGPALCVYNDSDFTPEDIAGIQLVGLGAKSEDPTKTGQFGVGFNSVYHLTDTPSFLTRGPNVETGETLCVFDPHCHYVTEATKENPGVQYVDIPDLRQSDPDVFACYPESLLKDKGTLFRFPLRTETIENTDPLSSAQVTEDDVNDLLHTFKNQMFESLLFVNNVQKITLSDLSSGELKEEYSVSLKMSAEDEEKRRGFFEKIKDAAAKLKECNDINQIEEFDVKYTLTVEDSEKRSKSWLIVQQLGFRKRESGIPTKLMEAYVRGELGLLPRGGIAMPLLQHLDEVPKHSYKAYCNLPLPLETGLPVHVNGHFALDHEARRNLWSDDTETFKSLWNKLLMQEVIAPAYVIALCDARKSLEIMDQIKRKDMFIMANVYYSLFPNVNNTLDKNWKSLAFFILKEIVESKESLFIRVDQEVHGDTDPKEEAKKSLGVSLSFFPLCSSSHKLHSVFDNLEEEQLKVHFYGGQTKAKVLALIFKDLGMQLLYSPKWIFESLQKAGVEPKPVSPEYVVRFLKTLLDLDSHSLDHVLITESVFKNLYNVAEVLEYCLQSQNFTRELEGIPLCVTDDEILQVFSKNNPVYCTKYCTLFPESSSLFVHQDLVSKVSRKEIEAALKPFSVQTLAELLPSNVSQNTYCTGDVIVPWNPYGTCIPDKKWMNFLWEFLLADLKPKIEELKKLSETNENDRKQGLSKEKKTNESEKSKKPFHQSVHQLNHLEKLEKKKESEGQMYLAKERLIFNSLDCISSWCFLPCTRFKYLPQSRILDHILLPIRMYKHILITGGFTESKRVAFNKLNLPDLYCTSVYGFLQTNLIANSRKPDRVLECLYLNRKEISNSVGLSDTDCLCIMAYFSENVSKIGETLPVEDKEKKLKGMPFYITIQGTTISLETELDVLVIPDEIPHEGITKWADNTKKILLKGFPSLQPIYSVLQLPEVGALDIYVHHIVPAFHFLPQSEWIFHLTYIRKNLLTIDHTDKKQRLLAEVLKNLHFVVTVQDGKKTTVTASEFFSPHNALFIEICEDQDFPPKPFNSKAWQHFMEIAGMRSEMAPDISVTFAKRIESQGRNRNSEKKSQILVRHLLQQEKILEKGDLLQRVANIEFILPHIVSDPLQNIYPQFQTTNFISFSNSVLSSQSELVWSMLPVLNDVADPSKYSHCDTEIYNIMQGLGIYEAPPLSLVLQHMQKICNSLHVQFEATDNKYPEFQIADLQHLFTSLYGYLQRSGLASSETKRRLHRKPVMFLPKYQKLVTCDTAVEEMDTYNVIEPYLYPAPAEFRPYFNLFKILGMACGVSSNTYAKVLEKLSVDVKGELNPNDLVIAKKAVVRLFNLLPFDKEEAQNAVSVDALYLPSRNLKLVDSTLLVFSNNPKLERKLDQEENLVYFAGFEDLKIQYLDEFSCMKSLPKKYRPKFLSNLVKKEVDKDLLDIELDSENANKLHRFVQSEEFIEGVLRLHAHEMRRDKTKLHRKRSEIEHESKCITSNLKSIHISQVVDIHVSYWYNNKVIGKDTESSHFVEEEIDGNKQFVYYFSLAKKQSIVRSVSNTFAHLINRCANNSLKNNRPLVLLMLKTCLKEPGEISNFLDENEIMPYGLLPEIARSLFPPPGTPVHPRWHSRLDNSFQNFKIGEYVAILVFDNEDQSFDSEFIYARVAKEVPCMNVEVEMKPVIQKYEVDVGNEFKVFPGYMIYQFLRNQSPGSEIIPVSDSFPTYEDSEDLTSLYKYIRTFLKSVWDLIDQDERRLIIKRLIRKWHPDKNIGDDKAVSVYHYINFCITKLENGEDIDDDNTEFDAGDKYAEHAWSRQICESLMRNKEVENEFQNSFSLYQSACLEPVSMPGNARIWYKQAEKDLDAAKKFNTLADDVQGFNWICYMCHQSVEKSLKSVWYFKDASCSHLYSHSLTSSACGLNPELREQAEQVESLLGDHTRMRYPDLRSKPPSDVYTMEQAKEAIDIADKVLNVTDSLIPKLKDNTKEPNVTDNTKNTENSYF